MTYRSEAFHFIMSSIRETAASFRADRDIRAATIVLWYGAAFGLAAKNAPEAAEVTRFVNAALGSPTKPMGDDSLYTMACQDNDVWRRKRQNAGLPI
jgi:hypothetical protein